MKYAVKLQALGAMGLLSMGLLAAGCKSAPPLDKTAAQNMIQAKLDSTPATGIDIIVNDLGMGEGRNAIYLAQHGWDVTGVDYAPAGVAKARQRAQSLGIKLNALVENADQFDFGSNQWDLVCLLYAPGAEEVHDFAKRLAASLKTGGMVVSEQPYATPKSLSEQATAWSELDLKLLRLEYREEQSDWGQPSFGRLLFQKVKR